MEVLRFAGLARHYGAHEVFTALDGVVRDGDKIGIVGPNGAGKSSLVRMLAGRDAADDGGEIVRARDRRLGYLAQDAAESGPATLRAAFDDARAAGRAQAWEVRATLTRFGFGDDDLDRPLAEFSGGQRTRALVARTLLEGPDWLILDEPTNHLDLDTVRWLETFLAKDRRAFVVVSHDRYFLETIANTIWELDRGTLSTYDVRPGRAYTDFQEQRTARREAARRAYEASLTERARQQAVIDELKTHGSYNYSGVRSREKALARVAVEPAPVTERRHVGVALGAARRATTGFAIEAKGLAKTYDRELFRDFTGSFARGERVAIVGPNGAGKTTLLRILAGDLEPDRGSVRYGTGLSTARYAQISADDLPPHVSAVDAVMAIGVRDEEARGLLGRLGLGGDGAEKPVEAFSGGERRRIMLARLMAQKADCLFLDEPTNDLDIPSREALEDVLASYEGALFVVSHDRYLLKRLGDRVIEVRDGSARLAPGDYAAYELAEHERPAEPPAAQPRPSPPAKLARETARAAREEQQRRRRAVTQAEKRVADLEREHAALEAQFAASETYDDRALVARLREQMQRNTAALEEAMGAWERAVEAEATTV